MRELLRHVTALQCSTGPAACGFCSEIGCYAATGRFGGRESEGDEGERFRVGSAMLAIYVGTAYARCMQYTIRNLPARLDKLIRKRAKEEGKSLNTVALEALMEAFGLRGSVSARRDLSKLAGSWVEDVAVDEALRAQRCIDDEMWR